MQWVTRNPLSITNICRWGRWEGFLFLNRGEFRASKIFFYNYGLILALCSDSHSSKITSSLHHTSTSTSTNKFQANNNYITSFSPKRTSSLHQLQLQQINYIQTTSSLHHFHPKEQIHYTIHQLQLQQINSIHTPSLHICDVCIRDCCFSDSRAIDL